MVKKDNKRLTITFTQNGLKALRIVMNELHTKQPSKAIEHLLSWVLRIN